MPTIWRMGFIKDSQVFLFSACAPHGRLGFGSLFFSMSDKHSPYGLVSSLVVLQAAVQSARHTFCFQSAQLHTAIAGRPNRLQPHQPWLLGVRLRNLPFWWWFRLCRRRVGGADRTRRRGSSLSSFRRRAHSAASASLSKTFGLLFSWQLPLLVYPWLHIPSISAFG